jgi:hypothetical protein
MTYYVQKNLALGPIRFGVSARRALDTIDDDPALSTGAKGEFIRRRQDGFFSGDTSQVVEPVAPRTKSISQTAFFSSLKPDGTSRGYAFLALMAFGILFILLGFSVLARKGPQGWVEVIIGVTCIGIPIAMTAQQRKQIRDQEERERAEREALEARNLEMLTWYTKALNHLRVDRSEASLQALRGERESLTVPYEIWGPSARRTILEIGFDELAKRGVAESAAIAALLRNAGEAAGLTPEDIRGVQRDLYAIVVWHLLADDRLGNAQEAELQTLRNALGITDDDIPVEAHAVEQFRSLRRVSTAGLPRSQCSIPLTFQEYCIHQAPLDTGMLFITNRRLLADEKKRTTVLMPKVFEIVVDVDESIIAIKSDQKKPLRVRLANPIFTAAIIDLASALDERPKGFA